MSPHSSESIFARRYGICQQQCNTCNCPWRVWLILRERHTNAQDILREDKPSIDTDIIERIKEIPIDARSTSLFVQEGCDHSEDDFAPPMRGIHLE